MVIEAPYFAPSSSAAATVFITGATGICSGNINGAYYATDEQSEDYPVYCRSDDGTMCIEHLGGEWQVKNFFHKGSSAGVAIVAGGCALELCVSRVWRIHTQHIYNQHYGNDPPLVEQPAVSLLVGADAERAVSSAVHVSGFMCLGVGCCDAPLSSEHSVCKLRNMMCRLLLQLGPSLKTTRALARSSFLALPLLHQLQTPPPQQQQPYLTSPSMACSIRARREARTAA